jgi:UPF0755 protein
MVRNIIRVVLLFLILLLIASFGTAGYAAFLNSPPAEEESAPESFSIAKGESLLSVSKRLEAMRLIRSAAFLVILSKIQKTETLFQAGSYLVPRGITTREVHNFFITGSQLLIRVTVPEGWTLTRIASYLDEKKIVEKEKFVKSARDTGLLAKFGIRAESFEGYLFPDTYLFPEDFPADKVVIRMVENFFQKLKDIHPDYDTLSRKALHEKVILASIIEREYQSSEEAPLMASVFYNRLSVNMALGSCATVEYIITEIQEKPHPGFLTYRDLEIPSPYNTYRNPGLPPGPIANPGKTALFAAFNPAETDYWYFVLRDPATGKHFFSKNLQEHNRAKIVYLKKVSSGS